MTQRRWAWMEVDLAAVAHNVAALKAVLKPGVLFMAVVKADAYGHGAVEVAKAAVAAGADRLGVATVDEALALRRAGITAPIHLLSEPPPEAAGLVVNNALSPMLYSRDLAIALSKAATLAGTVARFNLKVDTGLNRIGVPAEQAADLVESLRGLPGIAMEGTTTHFATAEVPGDWEFDEQVKRFDATLSDMRSRGMDPGIVHAANTAATVLHPETQYGMVRCGIGVYGLHPSAATAAKVTLEPAMSLKARIVRLKRLAMGEGVSYGFTYHAPAPVTIATLPLGYADGVRRGLSNRTSVLIGGVECPQVGRVCMDLMMVEVPRGTKAAVGDEAVFVGAQGSSRLTLDTQAATLDTIHYEVACGYGMRLPRRYRGSA